MPKGTNGSARAVFFIALINNVDARVAELAKEIPGIMVLSGNNSTVSAILSTFVLEM